MSDPTVSYPPPAGPPKRSWWKRPVALWIAIVAGLAGFTVGAVAGAGGKKADKTVAAVATTSSTTTTTQPTPTTPFVTLPASTVPVDPVASFVVFFASSRDKVIASITKDGQVQSVDKFVFDHPSVVLDVTSKWAAPDNQADGAWEITRLMSGLWRPNSSYNANGFAPDFHLVNSGRSYQCSADFMAKLATSNAARSDWEAGC